MINTDYQNIYNEVVTDFVNKGTTYLNAKSNFKDETFSQVRKDYKNFFMSFIYNSLNNNETQKQETTLFDMNKVFKENKEGFKSKVEEVRSQLINKNLETGKIDEWANKIMGDEEVFLKEKCTLRNDITDVSRIIDIASSFKTESKRVKKIEEFKLFKASKKEYNEAVRTYAPFYGQEELNSILKNGFTKQSDFEEVNRKLRYTLAKGKK